VAGQLAANTTVLAHGAVDHAVDVLGLQEVKLGAVGVVDFVHQLNAAVASYAAQRREQHSGFVVRAAPNAAATASAGVLLLFRRVLVEQGVLDLRPEANTDFDWGGRLVSAGVKWGGHSIQLANVYCPNDPTPRAAFIRSSVATAWQRQPQGSFLMGDWNFVPDPVGDRRHKRGQPTGDVHGDSGSAEALQRAAPEAEDVFRLKHPTAKNYTYN
jgi:exonuclease III